MSDGPTINADAVREFFTRAVRENPSACGAWFSKRGDGHNYELWVLIEPSDVEQERQHYGLLAALYEHFPDADFMLHILNPRMYADRAPERVVPGTAEQVLAAASA